MVCAGITKTATRITIQYNASDGTKGASFSNPYTLGDIYDTAVEGGWTGDFNKEGAVYTTKCEIYILGITTYVHFYAATLQWIASGTYLIDLSSSYFDVGSDGTVEKEGCTFINRCGAVKNYRLYGRARIYDTSFTGDRLLSGNGTIYPSAYGGAAYPFILERCTFINMTYTPSFNLSGASYANVIHRDCFILNAAYAIQLYGTQFSELSGLRAIGKIFTLLGSSSMTVIGRNWNCPRGTADFRVYSSTGSTVLLRMIDCITGAIQPRSNYALSVIGDKGIAQWESTFNFNITNGENAAIKMYNVENTLVIDTALDASGKLTGEEIIYRIYSQEKIGDSQWETINKYTHPFKVVIEKEGYQKLEIDNITVTSGVPTIIRGMLKGSPLQLKSLKLSK